MDEYLKGIMERVGKIKDAQARVDLAYAEEMGYDAGLNGANETNSHFAIFSRRKFTEAWERGKKRGDEAKRSSAANGGKAE